MMNAMIEKEKIKLYFDTFPRRSCKRQCLYDVKIRTFSSFNLKRISRLELAIRWRTLPKSCDFFFFTQLETEAITSLCLSVPSIYITDI